MSRLFDREAAMIVGPRGELGTRVTDLRFNFRVEKNLSSEPNALSLSVYNLNDRSIGFIQSEDAVITLQAGYRGMIENIFSGDVDHTEVTRQGPDRVTKIESGDGSRAIESRVAFSFDSGTTVAEVVEKVMASMSAKSVIGEIKGAMTDQFANGFSASGLAKDVMDRLAAKMDFSWSIQDNEITVIPKTEASDDVAIFVSPQTGLLGSPSPTEGGLVLNTLMLPKARPGKKINLSSRDYVGIYKISRVIHSGDTRGPQWGSEMEVAEL